jgi:hypothetical protein
MAEVNLLDEMARVEKAGLVSTFLGKSRPPHKGDLHMVEVGSPEVELTRTQTIMKGAQYCDFRYRCQLQLGQQLVARTREAGRRVQFECTWRVGDPLPFGLYQIGDSAMPG